MKENIKRVSRKKPVKNQEFNKNLTTLDYFAGQILCALMIKNYTIHTDDSDFDVLKEESYRLASRMFLIKGLEE